MIHVLDFDSNIIDFISNDDNSVIRADYKRDADSELLDIVILSKRAEHFKRRNRVIIQDKNSIYREFIIERVQDEGQYTTIECNASYFSDIGTAKPILAGKYEKTTVNDKLSEVLKDTGWTVGDCDFAGIKSMSWTGTQTPYEMIKMIETNHELKASYEIVISGNEVIERKVNMHEPIALFKGKEILFGKDLINMKRTIDFSDVKTALIALAPEDDKGQRITTVVFDDVAQEQFNLPQRYIWGIYEPESNEQNMTLERLTTLATTELNKRKSASISYEITVADIEEEYSHEVVRYGDLVRIKNNDFTPSLYAESEVMGFTHDLISDDCTYTFGRIVEYKEDDLLKYFRSKLDNFNQKLNDSISNVNTIVQDTLDTELQYFEKKIVKSDTPPQNVVNDVFWLDTSNSNVPILKRYWEGQWIKASVDNVEQIGGITREKALFSELSNTFINLTIQHSKLLNEMHEVMNSEYLVDEDIKTSLNINLDKTVTVFNNIKTNLEIMNEDTATIGKLVDTQALFLKYREQLQALYKVVEQAKLSIDARFKLLQSQYTDEKFNEAMETVAKTLPNGKWNADTKTLTSDVPNQDKLDSIVNDLKLFVNNQDNALETKIGKSVDAKIVDTKNEFTRQFTEVNSKVDKLSFENRNLLLNTNKEYPKPVREFLQTEDLSVVFDKYPLTQKYSLSFDMKATKQGNVNVYMQNGSGTKYNFVSDTVRATTEYQRFKFEGLSPSLSKNTETKAMLAFYGTYDSGVFPIVRNIKLELGSKSTPYSIAPEDIDKSINDVKVRVETVEGGLTATNKKFETVYSKTETEQLLNSNLQPIKTDVNSTKSSIEQLDKEIKTKVSQSTYTTDQANVIQRLNSANSERKQLSNQIADRVTITEYNNDIEAIENDTDRKLNTMKTEILQDGKQIAQTVSSEVFNAKAKTLNKVVSQYINDTATGHQFTYDENGNITNFTVGSSGIKLNAKVIDMNDGDVTIKNGVTTIQDAYIPKLFSKKATIEYLDAIGITAKTLQAGDKQASVSIENGSLTLNKSNGTKMDISIDGIQMFNAGGSTRFSIDRNIVTSAALGTSNSNVYLAADSDYEARVVDRNELPGDGLVASYRYRPIRALVYKFPDIPNAYFSLLNGGEFRFTGEVTGEGRVYQKLRASGYYGDFLDGNSQTPGTNLYVRPYGDAEVRFTQSGTTDKYVDIRGKAIFGSSFITNSTHAYIGTDGELRVQNKGLSGTYRNLRASGYYGDFVETTATNMYVRASGEARFTANGTTGTYIPIRFKEWTATSHETYKHDISEWDYNVLDVYRNDLQLHKYKFNSDRDSGWNRYRHGIVIRSQMANDTFPIEWRNGDGFDGNEVLWWNTKAIQELALENETLKNKLSNLENKFKELEDKING